MQRKYQWMLGLLLAVLVIGVNTYFIWQKNSHVERSFYVSDWDRATTADLKQTLHKKGILAPDDTHHLYFDQKQGAFEKFLVNKGDSVKEGTPLYTYRVGDAQKARRTLEMKVDKLEGKVQSLDTHIQKLQQLKASAAAESRDLGQSQTTTAETADDADGTGDTRDRRPPRSAPGNGEVIEKQIQLQISKAQQKKDEAKQQMDAYKTQMQKLQDQESVTVKSAYTGIVQAISEDLDNPVVTIAAEKLLVQGKLREAHINDVKKGMSARIGSDHFKKGMKGKVSAIDQFPKGDPSVAQTSLYPFTVQFDGDTPEAHPGEHVTLDIVTAEAENAVIIPENVVSDKGDNQHVWVLADKGIVDSRHLQIGLQAKGQMAVEKGLKSGSFLVEHPENIDKDGAAFFTPFKWRQIPFSLFQTTEPDVYGQAFLQGLL